MTSPRQRSFPGVLVTLLAVIAAGACGNSSNKPSGTGGSGAGGQAGANAGTGGAAAPGTGGVTGTGGAGMGGAAGGTSDAAVDRGTTDARDGAASDARSDATASDARNDAGGDGGVAFNPCPSNQTCIIMPLGDSITEGYPTFTGGYRVELFSRAVLANKAITFVGRRMNGPAGGMVQGKVFPPGCEGYSGYTIDTETNPMDNGIQPLVNAAINMFHPHIILMMIGTNDINQNIDVANAPTRLAALIDQITTAAPSALLVVAQIIPTTTDAINTRIMAYNAAMPALINQRAAAGKHVQLVNMYGAFTANAAYKTALMTDVLHPNAAGYGLLGDTWYNQISGLLPAAP